MHVVLVHVCMLHLVLCKLHRVQACASSILCKLHLVVCMIICEQAVGCGQLRVCLVLLMQRRLWIQWLLLQLLLRLRRQRLLRQQRQLWQQRLLRQQRLLLQLRQLLWQHRLLRRLCLLLLGEPRLFLLWLGHELTQTLQLLDLLSLGGVLGWGRPVL